MVSKKSAARQKPAAPNTKSSLPTGSTAALTVSAFSPAALNLNLFASVVLGLDAYRLRVHDTNTGRLRCEHVLEKGVTVGALSWGVLPPKDKKSAPKKKRKRIAGEAQEESAEVDGTVVVAAATNRGSVILFSPSEAQIVGVLEGEHVGAVKDFQFVSGEEGRGWSCGVDGRLVLWDTVAKVSLSTFPLPEASIQRVAPAGQRVLCASNTVYAVDKDNAGLTDMPTFTANTTPIHTLIAASDADHFLSAAETDRFINIFSLSASKHTGALVAESDVHQVSVFAAAKETVLTAVTADGLVEVFTSPFTLPEDPSTSRKKKTATAKSSAKIQITRPNSSVPVPIAAAAVGKSELTLAYLEGAVNVSFEKIPWTNADGTLALSGLHTLTREKNTTLAAAAAAGAKSTANMQVDQAQTVVVAGADQADLELPDADAAESDDAATTDDESDDEDAPAKAEEPTFADRFSALEVSAAPHTSLTTTSSRGAPKTPSAGALTSVLTQALKTNDTALLESCLSSTSPTTIRNTVRKLPSPLAVTLLERLAERLARKPGRAGSLGEWVRWTLVAHGGYLVTLPNLVRTLSGLYSTLNTRAGALPRLLALQGRLDMLHSQVALREEIRAGAAAANEEAEKAVVYVEGETAEVDSDEESDEEPEEVGMESMVIEDASYIRGGEVGSDGESEGEDEEDEGDSEDEGMDTDEREEDERMLLGVESSESEGEGDDESVDYDDVESEDEGKAKRK